MAGGVSWIPALLVAYSFGLCESIQPSEGGLTEPGVIVGIIVGVVGVLVVIGVSILLCRLICCRETPCCSCCCKDEETYLEAGTVPIKIPTQESAPDKQPISSISQNHPTGTRQSQAQARKGQDTDMPNLQQYDDIPQFDWKLADLMKKRAMDPERGSKDSLTSAKRSENYNFKADIDMPDILSDSGASQSGKSLVRRRLQYGADNMESPPHNDVAPAEHCDKSKKRNTETPRHGREFPVVGHKSQKRQVQSMHDDDKVLTKERNPNRTSDAQEFPLLEFEPRKRSSPDKTHRSQDEETHGGGDGHLSSVEFYHYPHILQPPHSAPQSMNHNVVGGDREFQSLEYESDQCGFNPSYAARTVEERNETDWEFRPVEFDSEFCQPYQPQSVQSYYSQSTQPYKLQSTQPYVLQPLQHPNLDHRSRRWDEEVRGPREQQENLGTQAPTSQDRRFVPGAAQFSQGRDNMAFNPDSTETTV